ncbi:MULTISPECIES: hypothetical protein [Bartonella]|uniref:Uncharacterized protein n=1 Tax=Bartonella rochalimae ATCC BAA-1498 TaxID=685782 RepID=E6YMN8_9HYPH|nr:MULTISPECIES: hypothetical protein [Bartonella]AQX18114.1 hypothetical protein BA1379B_002670 [Bartonella sp. A1379B]AQX22629.1 hypothetical protein Bho11B_006070 [Bartonella sp. 11B]AQX24088.1 hypothetical protein Bho114_007690 [Bartonella sp. 114]AQX25078.1 hypothetical protein Bco22_003810 [Bartonella sp. Coyote22sub2]KEC56617.1 hypothetical protein O99_00516 [Bartonella rochalimae ATCC BAA-1498]
MIKFRWRNIILILLFILIAGLLAYRFVFNRIIVSHQMNKTKNMQLEEAISFPNVTMHLFKMNDQQKQRIVYQARKDAISSALASGQNNEQAQKFAEIVIRTVSEEILHPSTVNSY